MADLAGKTVAFLEGRRADELADLIRRHHGVPLAAPCLREVHQPDAPHLQRAIAELCQADLALSVWLTGVGVTTVFEAARHLGQDLHLRQRLESAVVAARGPKPAAALRALGLRIDVQTSPPHTSASLLEALGAVDVAGRAVAVQLYGEPNPELSQALRRRGASVIELAPYVWDRPADPRPLLGLLDALECGRVQALLITSQAQVEQLFAIAAEQRRSPRLDGVAIGVQGPVAAAALARHGYRADFAPEHGHMGALVLAAARHFDAPTGAREQRA